MKFIIRSYRPGDEHQIMEMFNEVFHQNLDLSYWYWKYRDNPYGSYRISLAATESGVLAAHYAGYPLVLSSYFPGRPYAEINTYQLGDKMSRKTFRAAGFGKGALIARAYAHFKDTYMNESIPFAYGFAAHHSLRFGTLILNYVDVESVTYRKIDIFGLNSLAVNSIKRQITRLRVDEVSGIDERWSDFFNKTAPYYTFLSKRDAAYLRWRYFERPDRKYLMLSVKKGRKLVGWSVFYREANKIIWGDALFSPEDVDAIKSVLLNLRDHPYAEGAGFIECWFPPRPLWWDDILRSLNFISGAEPSNLHLTSPVFSDPAAPEMLSKYFYYTMGDSDLF
jgi:hypothetical protein